MRIKLGKTELEKEIQVIKWRGGGPKMRLRWL